MDSTEVGKVSRQGEGELRGIALARDKGRGDRGSRQQQEEQPEKLEGEPSILINHTRSERGMQRLDLQELSQAINFHWLPGAWSLEPGGQRPET